MQSPQAKLPGSRALFFNSCAGACGDVIPLLESRGLRVTERRLDVDAENYTASVRPDWIFIEHSQQSPRDWQRIAFDVRRASPETPMLLLVAGGSEETAVAALRLGVEDYIALPVEAQSLSEALARCARCQRRDRQWGQAAERELNPSCDAMVGASENLSRVKNYMKRVAASDCTVLITGETGTGKELAAEFIHSQSSRRNKPFVCVNCAAIPDPLLESELFGHIRGAFTGADSKRDGLFASAEGGTVLLDEIGDMSLTAQAKILRVLEKKEVSRLGGTQRQKVDIRFLAATNQDLENMTELGTFRRDLYYRLNVARVELPPLRERKDDIHLLVEHYRKLLGGDEVARISEDCMRHLSRHNWPGNIRELKNVLESIFLHCTSDEAQVDDLPPRLLDTSQEPRLSPDERERLVEALCATRWNKSRAAEKLRWSRMTLYRKMAKYQLSSVAASLRGGASAL
ncbi:sigma-54 dependent transcriptional regulator [Granulicella sp. L46]|jgi:DNA-binding NtrC family response regulator|uniref:sigma-54-dependent transcriptional regulator n=1 Tax=Granulicella sp. L46 TaxID=1641865 RepID=UPI00131B880B|nr:sigma-54 dependent transcriptional regulator [Granulicella sp. L46]